MTRPASLGTILPALILAAATAAPAAAANYSIIYSASGSYAFSHAAPASDSAGRLYIQGAGGSFHSGAMYQLTPPSVQGAPWSVADIYDFSNDQAGVFFSSFPVTVDSGGNIYGSGTEACGDQYSFVIYRLSPTGQTYHKRNLVCSTADGNYDGTGATFGADGLLYSGARRNSDSAGVLWQVPPTSGPGHSRVEANGVPSSFSALTRGRLFFTTTTGGDYGLGTVEELITKANAPPRLAVIYSFQGGANAQNPGSPTVGFGSKIYGCAAGGANALGSIYELTPPANGAPWTESVIYSFTAADTFEPLVCALTTGPDGTLIGDTTAGGPHRSGVIFALEPPAPGGDVWTYKVLHAFAAFRGDLYGVGAPVVIGNAIFGSSDYGGAQGIGGVFELTR